MHFYASIHAPEIVYFYGLRAIRQTLPTDDPKGDWVARGLKKHVLADQDADQPQCSSTSV